MVVEVVLTMVIVKAVAAAVVWVITAAVFWCRGRWGRNRVRPDMLAKRNDVDAGRSTM